MKIERLFKILYVLLGKETATARELATRFEVSTRTIYRDVETLCMAGMPVYMHKGKGGGISLLPDFVLNKAMLTDTEKMNIMSSLRATQALVPGIDASSEPETRDTALEKLGAIFGGLRADWIEVDFSSWAGADSEKALFQTLRTAILGKRVLSFLYSSGKAQTVRRSVEALKLGFKGQAWYLYGWCRTRRAARFFKLTRMKDLRVSDETFERSCPLRIFTDDTVFQEEHFTVKLRISAEAAHRVYDDFSCFEETDEGDFVVVSVGPGGDWLYSYIASFGASCEILEPAELREDFIRRTEDILKIYK